MVWMSEKRLPGAGQHVEMLSEAEMIREFTTHSGCGAIVVSVEGVVYTGEYEFMTAFDYAPGEWQNGTSIPIRFAGDKLFLRRPNGCELQIMIVKRIG